ncbi:MAG TPA: VCBS domain-containing protein [Bradyrhizobium sp.]|nr:VCBS domain-containing protein [Bradyrhizobium sp.]
MFGLSSNARMVLNEMVYDPNGSNNSSLLSLVAGTITFVAGETAKHGDMKVDTPVATMGIRGTAVLVEIDFKIPVQDFNTITPDNLSQSLPEVNLQVLVEPDGTTGSFFAFEKGTLVKLAEISEAGQQFKITSQGVVSVTNAPLPPDVQKLITDVFALKFTDNTNTKTLEHQFTDSIVPQSLQPIILASGTTAIPIIVNVNTVQSGTPPPSNGPSNPNFHIDRAPDAAATGNASVEITGVTHSSAIDSVSGTITFADINAGDLPTVTTKFDSFTYKDSHGNDVTATLNAQQLADVAAVEAKLVLVAAAGNTNTGSVNWTYSLADSNFDFLAKGETLTLTYLALVDNNFVQDEAVTKVPFTITFTGTNDAPTIAATNAALAEHSGVIDHVGGTITFADVDLTDRPVVSTTFGSFTYKDSHGNDISSTLTAAQQTAVETSLNLIPSLSNTNNGSVHWSYEVADSNLGFLADGSTLTLTYTASVDDGHGGVTTAPITVSILGISDVPHLITERPGQTGDTALADSDTASGALTFAGVDLTSVLSIVPSLVSATWSGGSVLPSGLAGTLDSSFHTSLGSSVGFTFSATDNNFDFLADGETLAIVYDITVTDTHGVSLTRPVTIIVTGTDDTPHITSGAQTGTITELFNPSQPNPTGSTTPDTASGAVTFTDVDLSDTHTVTVTGVVASGVTTGLPANATVLGWISLGALTDTTGTGLGGSDGWSFSAQDKSFDYLAVGESVTLTYTVQVDDHHGGLTSQDVVVTVTGTNDTPHITSGAQTGTITELAGVTGSTTPDTASGAVTFTDVDLSDHHTVTVTGVVASGVTTGLPANATVLGWLALGAPHDTTGTGLGGSDAWTFSAQDKNFDYLAAGQTVTLTYTVQVSDGNGGVVTQPVAITITGTSEPGITVTGFTFDKTGNIDHFIVTATDSAPITSVEIFDFYGTANQLDLGPALLVSGTSTNGTWTLSESNNHFPANTLTNHDTLTAVVSDGTTTALATLSLANFDLDPAGVAGEPINLGLAAASASDGALITIAIADVPSGWTVNGGTLNNGTWTLQTSNPASLTITSPADFTGAMLFNVTETWTQADGSIAMNVVQDNAEAYSAGSPIFALAANDYLTGSSGSDEFVFAQPISNDVIYSFDVASDKIDLIGFSNVASFSDIQANLTDDANGNAVITLGAGETITLQGVHAAALNPNDFAFDQTPVTNNAGSMTIGDGAILPLSGTINNTGTIALNSTGDQTDLQLIEHGITLQGGGEVVLSDSAENVITGTSADVTLTNVDNTISGSGQLGMGQLTLVNEGTIDATGADALTIDTGANVVTNSGTLEATGTGGLTVLSAIANSGTLWANGAAITVQGNVSGNGTAMINGSGALDFEAASTANVVFGAGAAGTLKLGDAFHFNGTISGFAASDTIDLANVGAATASISYHENAAGTGGTLAISDGAQTVDLALLGHYTESNFSIVPDQAKGILVSFVPHDLIV